MPTEQETIDQIILEVVDDIVDKIELDIEDESTNLKIEPFNLIDRVANELKARLDIDSA